MKKTILFYSYEYGIIHLLPYSAMEIYVDMYEMGIFSF